MSIYSIYNWSLYHLLLGRNKEYNDSVQISAVSWDRALSGISRDAKDAIMGSIMEFTRAGVSHTEGISETAIRYLHGTFGLASSALRIDVFSHIFIEANNHYTEGKENVPAQAKKAKTALIGQVDRLLSADPERSVRYGVYEALGKHNFFIRA